MTEPEQWDAKHRGRRAGGPGSLDSFVLRALDLLGPGAGRTAWDLAAGRGRHAFELARRGWKTTAFDRSREALAQIESAAEELQCSLSTTTCDLSLACWERGHGRADLILVVNYLDRTLYARLPELLVPGGSLLLTTFTTDREGDHPSARWCLEPGELAHQFPRERTLSSEERNGRAGLLTQFGVSGSAPPQ